MNQKHTNSGSIVSTAWNAGTNSKCSRTTGVACRNPGEVAASILASSYAVLCVEADDALADAIASARIAARDFFRRTASSFPGGGAGAACPAAAPSISVGHLVRHRRVVDGLGVAGLNRPSEAKLLFRSWFRDEGTGRDDGDGNEYREGRPLENRPRLRCHPHQPWPDGEDDECCRLRKSSHALAEMLHALLAACLEEVTVQIRAERAGMVAMPLPEMSMTRTPIVGDKHSGHEARRIIGGNKRRRLCGEKSGEDERGEKKEHRDKTTFVNDFNSRNGTNDGHVSIACAALDSPSPPSSSYSCSNGDSGGNRNCGNDKETPSSSSCAWCPLDYFLYRGGTAAGENCAEHVDRGALVCVALSPDVPGLEVLPRGVSTRESESLASRSESMCGFFCPEEEERERLRWMGRADGGGASSCVHGGVGGALLCIMAGDQLKQACSSGDIMEEQEVEVANQRSLSRPLDSCVHRVRRSFDGERLSVTYELRLPHT